MKRLFIGAIAFIGVCGAVVMSGGRGGWKTYFPLEERNPVTHLRWNDERDEFRFAIVSDRTGSHRAGVFSQAVDKLNLLQPEFILCVGDLIEGGKKPADTLAAEWKEFDTFVTKLTMPFFYVPGNHDVGVTETAKFWEGKLGRRYYHFVYRNVLFLLLNTDDPPGSVGNIGKEQLAYAQKTIKDNPGVRWTIVAIHRPLWTFSDGAKNGWGNIEKALRDRSYTVFCGHVHRYEKFVRQGMNYYQLATTGGGSLMRGADYGEFDHLVWVTMKKDGPLLANILLDSVQPENLQTIKTEESGFSTAKRKATHPVRGSAYFEGAPMAGAFITLTSEKDLPPAKPTRAFGVVEADGSFKLSTYQAFDGAPVGEYLISLTWRPAGKTGSSMLPARYDTPAKSGLRATITAGTNDIVLELKR
jgi:serine/threonine-protein phosphatase CPPED1